MIHTVYYSYKFLEHNSEHVKAKKKKHEKNIQSSKIVVELMLPVGRQRERINWEIRIDIYTLSQSVQSLSRIRLFSTP